MSIWNNNLRNNFLKPSLNVSLNKNDDKDKKINGLQNKLITQQTNFSNIENKYKVEINKLKIKINNCKTELLHYIEKNNILSDENIKQLSLDINTNKEDIEKDFNNKLNKKQEEIRQEYNNKLLKQKEDLIKLNEDINNNLKYKNKQLIKSSMDDLKVIKNLEKTIIENKEIIQQLIQKETQNKDKYDHKSNNKKINELSDEINFYKSRLKLSEIACKDYIKDNEKFKLEIKKYKKLIDDNEINQYKMKYLSLKREINVSK